MPAGSGWSSPKPPSVLATAPRARAGSARPSPLMALAPSTPRPAAEPLSKVRRDTSIVHLPPSGSGREHLQPRWPADDAPRSAKRAPGEHLGAGRDGLSPAHAGYRL